MQSLFRPRVVLNCRNLTELHMQKMRDESAIHLSELALSERAVMVLQAGRNGLSDAPPQRRRHAANVGRSEARVERQLPVRAGIEYQAKRRHQVDHGG